MTNKEIIQRLEELREDILSKNGRMFFFVSDTAGVPMASVEQIYKMAKLIQDEGYKVIMVHEKDKFIGVESWMGAEYSSIKHISIGSMNNSEEYKITGADTFFIPELFSDLIKKLHETKLPSDTVVICQSHTFIFKYLNAGETWSQYDVENVITTSNKMKLFLQEYQPTKNVFVVNPVISEDFNPEENALPQKPIISIISRVPDDIERVAKLFYQKYPMYSWISFRTLGSMKKSEFARALKESCLSVWIDDFATFGTFPLESMKSGVPCIIKIPDMIPEWAENFTQEGITLSDNAIYVPNVLAIPDYIAKFMEAWLLNDVPETLYQNMKAAPGIYTEENFVSQAKKTFEAIIEGKLSKLEQTIQKYQEENEQ